MAATLLSHDSQQPDLQPSIVVSDLYARVATAARQNPRWNDRKHFYGCAYRVMRQILVDHARKRQAIKRGGGLEREYPEIDTLPMGANGLQRLTKLPNDTEHIRSALDRLNESDPVAFEIFWRRWAFGHTYRQIAADLDMGETTARDNWHFASAWLRRECGPDERTP